MSNGCTLSTETYQSAFGRSHGLGAVVGVGTGAIPVANLKSHIEGTLKHPSVSRNLEEEESNIEANNFLSSKLHSPWVWGPGRRRRQSLQPPGAADSEPSISRHPKTHTHTKE